MPPLERNNSSSPCKCGGCGVDSSSSSPKNTPSQRTRLPDTTTSTSTRHGWDGIIGTPPRPSTASPGLLPRSSPDTPACTRLSKLSPAARRLPLGENAPGRRIDLDGERTPTVAKIGDINHSNYGAVGGSNDLASERKRGSDGARSTSGNSRGNFAPATGLSFEDNAPAVAAQVTTTAAAATAAASCAAAAAAAGANIDATSTTPTSEKKCGGFFGPTCTMAPAEARAYAAAAAFASLASSDCGDDDEEEGGEEEGGDAVKGCGSRDQGWNFPVQQGFGAPAEGASVPFGGAFSQPFTGVSAGSSPNSARRGGGGGGEGGVWSSNMKVDSLDEWKAPETGGIFSLGAPPQSNGFGRRRRMRVGG